MHSVTFDFATRDCRRSATFPGAPGNKFFGINGLRIIEEKAPDFRILTWIKGREDEPAFAAPDTTARQSPPDIRGETAMRHVRPEKRIATAGGRDPASRRIAHTRRDAYLLLRSWLAYTRTALSRGDFGRSAQ